MAQGDEQRQKELGLYIFSTTFFEWVEMTTGTIPVTKLQPTPNKLHVFGQKQAVQKGLELL